MWREILAIAADIINSSYLRICFAKVVWANAQPAI